MNAADALPLAGRVALVTGGAGKGVGRATALALAREGADVALNTHRSLDRAEAVAEQIRSLGRRALVVPGDASDPAVVDELVGRARAELGAPGIVVASAGNDGSRGITYPAAYPGVISVAASGVATAEDPLTLGVAGWVAATRPSSVRARRYAKFWS